MEEKPTPPSELLPRMSVEDRLRYRCDMVMYGRAVMQEKDDGSVVYVPPERWPDPIKPKSEKR